jgi:hypothetical protein
MDDLHTRCVVCGYDVTDPAAERRPPLDVVGMPGWLDRIVPDLRLERRV